MTTLTVQDKLTLLPPQLLTELEDYLDFLLQKYHLQATPEPLPTALFGRCCGEIKILGDIISPLEVGGEVLKLPKGL